MDLIRISLCHTAWPALGFFFKRLCLRSSWIWNIRDPAGLYPLVCSSHAYGHPRR